jgi:spore coat polysaccharide biosynthesis predicted glycosyltransferase SpsG/GNAT superfamily N-acetyltransferase
MRSLALAEAAAAAGHEVVVAGCFEGSFVQGQLAAAPVEVVQLAAPLADGDLRPIIDLVRRLHPDVLHVDSYEAPGGLRELVASPEEEAILRDTVLSNVEDGTFGRRPADVVIDPTLGAELSPRPDDGSTWLLRGSRYTPIRRRVIAARRPDQTGTSTGEAARTVLVVMGGTDPIGLAPAVVELLARTGLALEVTAIGVGKNAERVRAAARGSALSLNVLPPVDDLAARMSRQDLVISAAGTSVWELCCIGVPMAVLWAVDNQREGYDRVVAAGAAVGLGGPELAGRHPVGIDPVGHGSAMGQLRAVLTDSGVRADMVLAGRRAVDGLGVWRVVRTWEQARRLGPSAGLGSSEQESSNLMKARQAEMQDAQLLWEWRNDPATRAGSRSSSEVSMDEHLGWLAASLDRSDRMLLLVMDAVGPVGTVRWDLGAEGEWEVSITVAPDRRGQSLARPLLRAAEVALSDGARLSGTEVTAYLAVVNVGNRASVRLFETSAYVPDLPPDPGGFMRFRKTARVASSVSRPWESV